MLLHHFLICLAVVCLGDGKRRHHPDPTTPEPFLPTSTLEPRREQPLEAVHHSPKRYKCGLHISKGCRCSKQMGTLSIICFKAGLRSVPVFDFGPTVVRTMNLQRNKITSINMMDFFGLKIEKLLLANNSIAELNQLAFWGLEYNLDHLDLSFNKFTDVPVDSLRLLRNVRTLYLTGNKITCVKNYAFSYLHKLEVLKLDKNPICHMEDRSFDGTSLFMLVLDDIKLENGLKTIPTKDLRELKHLSLKHNHIGVIPNGWLRNLSSLTALNLDGNKLNRIDDNTFSGAAQSLRKLQLNHNRIRKLPKVALRDLQTLETLELAHNRIKKIYAHSFNNSRDLTVLDLSHNLIYDLAVSALEGLEKLLRLDLRYNDMVFLDDRTFCWTNLTDRNVYISENPWLCNCLLKWLKKAHRKRLPLAGLFPDLLDVRCQRPWFWEGRPLVRIPLRDFTCDHDYYFYQTDDDYYTYDEDDDEYDEDEEDGDGGDEEEEEINEVEPVRDV